jgi:hypothetical protein
MEEILQDEFRGISDVNAIDQNLQSNGWRQDRDSSSYITKKQIRRGLRNNLR